VLDTQSGAAGGRYVSKVNDTDLAITRLTGRGDVAAKRPIGDSGILWSPMIEGGVGYGTFENNFDRGALLGNQSTVTTPAVFLAGGVRFTVWDDFTVAPTFGVIYGHSENDFEARNDAGRQLVQLAGSGTVDDVMNGSADTFTLVPGVELRYRHLFGGIIQLTLKSLFKYFHTQPISRSTTALSFESTSQWRFNEVDVEWRMPVYLWGRQLRTGAYVSRSDVFGARDVVRDGPPLSGGGPARHGRAEAAVEARVHRDRGRVLLVGHVLGLDRGRRGPLHILGDRMSRLADRVALSYAPGAYVIR
jgi:hypothetical protein